MQDVTLAEISFNVLLEGSMDPLRSLDVVVCTVPLICRKVCLMRLFLGAFSENIRSEVTYLSVVQIYYRKS